MKVVFGLITLAAITGSSIAFEVNVPIPELLQRTDRLTVMDLAVGEAGYVQLPTFCTDGENLFAYGVLSLAESADGGLLGPATRFKRMPDNQFEVTIVTEGRSSPPDEVLAQIGLAAATSPCSLETHLPNQVEIATVNGERDLRSLLP